VKAYLEVDSTNETARMSPDWTAVVANRQSRGRGRHGRIWQSGLGGLWCSLVLPTPGPVCHWESLPLAVGLAVIRTLQRWEIDARLRWPNDIMVDDRKLAGLLLERYDPGRVVVGIGLNIRNDPAEDDPSLAALVTTLSQLLPLAPQRDEVLVQLLECVRHTHQMMNQLGIEGLLTDLNSLWGSLPRTVRLILPDRQIEGSFLGVDSRGRLRLERSPGKLEMFSPAHVTQLIECQPH